MVALQRSFVVQLHKERNVLDDLVPEIDNWAEKKGLMLGSEDGGQSEKKDVLGNWESLG